MDKEEEKVDVTKILGKPKVVFAVGGRSAERRGICQKVIEEFPFYVYLSLGELLKEESTKDTIEGARVKKVFGKELVPLDLVQKMVVDKMVANPSKHYLIDGFPRSEEQAKWFESVIHCNQVLNFELPASLL